MTKWATDLLLVHDHASLVRSVLNNGWTIACLMEIRSNEPGDILGSKDLSFGRDLGEEFTRSWKQFSLCGVHLDLLHAIQIIDRMLALCPGKCNGTLMVHE